MQQAYMISAFQKVEPAKAESLYKYYIYASTKPFSQMASIKLTNAPCS